MHVTSKTVSISSEDGDNSMQQMLILSLTKLIGDFEQVLFSIPEDGRILELDLTRATFRAITGLVFGYGFQYVLLYCFLVSQDS